MEIDVPADLLGIAVFNALLEVREILQAAGGVMDIEHGRLLAGRQPVPVLGADLALDLLDAGGDFAVQAAPYFGFRKRKRALAGAVEQFAVRQLLGPREFDLLLGLGSRARFTGLGVLDLERHGDEGFLVIDQEAGADGFRPLGKSFASPDEHGMSVIGINECPIYGDAERKRAIWNFSDPDLAEFWRTNKFCHPALTEKIEGGSYWGGDWSQGNARDKPISIG